MFDYTNKPSVETIKKVLRIATRSIAREDAAMTIYAAHNLIAEEDEELKTLIYLNNISSALWSLKDTIKNPDHKLTLAAICAFLDTALAGLPPKESESPF